LDLSRFDAVPLITFTAVKEIDYGTETDGRIPPVRATDRTDQWANHCPAGDAGHRREGRCAQHLRAASIIRIVGRKADSTGRRNTFGSILFEQLVESFSWCLPIERFAWSCVQGMRDGAQLVRAMPAKICALWEVLA